MIYISRPVAETHKTVEKLEKTPLDSNMRGRKPVEPVWDNYDEGEKRRYNYQKEDLQRAIDDTNRMVFKNDNRFEFKIHERTGRMMVKLIDKETDEIIKEIPSEKILDLVASIWDLVGILVDERG